jgi:hypothetical protein
LRWQPADAACVAAAAVGGGDMSECEYRRAKERGRRRVKGWCANEKEKKIVKESEGEWRRFARV